MVRGVDSSVGEAVGTAVEVGSSSVAVTFPRGAQEVNKIKGNRNKASLRSKEFLQRKDAGILPENILPRREGTVAGYKKHQDACKRRPEKGRDHATGMILLDSDFDRLGTG
jgi:hypothetical protein